MSFSSLLDRIHFQARQNRWLWYFSIFCRLILVLGFIPSGLIKIVGERFASGLSVNHPMGHYLEALHHTGYYYTFIGIAQLVAAILLLIPRTVTLGAILYFPIILNICILSFAVRFEGSQVTSPLMVMANLYVICWNYHRLKFIFPFKKDAELLFVNSPKEYNTKFPVFFFTGVAVVVGMIILYAVFGHEVMPRNSLPDCEKQFKNSSNKEAGQRFCECIHTRGQNLQECLDEYENNKKVQIKKKIGDPCEGCEAIFEYGNKKLTSVDTLPEFQQHEPKLKITGTVFTKDGKTPAENVIVYIYHTNRRGIYETKGNETGWAKRHGFIRGWIKTGKDGHYTFYTFRPAAYPDGSEPEHIHITVKEPDKNEYYLDEYLFDDDSLLTQSRRSVLTNRGGSGILNPKVEDEMLAIQRNIILGKNIPDYE